MLLTPKAHVPHSLLLYYYIIILFIIIIIIIYCINVFVYYIVFVFYIIFHFYSRIKLKFYTRSFLIIIFYPEFEKN